MIINDTDQQILGLLRDNARLSISALASKVKVSRATVQKRLQWLQTEGIITGFTIRTRPTVERHQIRAWMNIMVEGTQTKAVIQALRLHPAVHSLHTTNGKWDLLVELRAAHLESFDQLLDNIRTIHGIYNTETSILLSTYKT